MGLTDIGDCSETLGQGSHGGAIVSSANICDGITEFFENSEDEISYGNTKINPCLFQDDVIRCTTTVAGAQAGLDRMEQVIESKLLDLHIDKTCHLIFANKENRNRIKQEIDKNPLIYKGNKIEEKQSEKWLGDVQHNSGNSDSIKATIRERAGRIKIGTMELIANFGGYPYASYRWSEGNPRDIRDGFGSCFIIQL